jgi:conflict system STAND superfamily ATPase/HEAT repeat protein
MTTTLSDSRVRTPMSSPAGTREFVIDRHVEGAEVARFILDAETRLVVLYGAPDSGKTELITHWVMPELRTALRGTDRQVFRGDCGPIFPAFFDGTDGSERFEDLLRRDNILVVDDFERILDLPRDEQRAELDRVFAQLMSRDAKAVVVLVTASRQLNGIYALSAYDPRATSAVCELRAMTVEDALSSLGSAQPDEQIVYMPAMLQAVSADCTTLSAPGWSDTFDLVKLVHTWCLGLRRESGVSTIDLQDYQRMGGARGMLRAHLEQHLETLEAEHRGDADIARTILERLLAAEATRSVADLSDVGPRIGTSSADVDRVLARMSEPDGLLRQKPGGILRVVPPQLLVVIEEDLATRKRQIERAHRIVAEGVRNWLQIGSLLPRPRFEEVHDERCFLSPDEEQTRFLLHCALLHERDTTAGAAFYWLRRIADREEGLNVLLISLVHPIADARRRSAALLGEYDQPEVRQRLRSVALADVDPQVRSQAVDSLARIKNDEVMNALLQEVNAAGSPYRSAAVEALRIFPRAEIAAVLQQLVNDPTVELPLRETATRVLATLNIPESVDALLDVALNDVDDDDRRAAAKALASTKSEDLNRRILLRLDAIPGTGIWVAAVVLGLLALLELSLWIALMVWLNATSNSEKDAAVGGVVVISLIAVALTARLLMKLRDQRLKLLSPLGIGAALVFALGTFTVFPVIHGLAHFAVGMRRRAVLLFGLELLGYLFIAIIAPFLETSEVLSWAAPIYMAAGVVLFVGTFVYDVVGAVLGSVMLRRAAILERRRRAAYEQLFTNPQAAGLVFDALENPKSTPIPSAKQLIRKFGRRATPAQLVTLLEAGSPASRKLVSRALRKNKIDETVRKLEELWARADRSLRRRIATILYREPNERSLEVLDRIRPQMGIAQRVRSSAARFLYGFIVWPRPLRYALLALLPPLAVLIFKAVKGVKNPAWPQIVALQQKPFRVSEQQKAQKVKIVQFLADVYPSESGPELFTIFKKDRKSLEDPVHAAIAQALVRIDTTPVVPSQDKWRPELLRTVASYTDLLLKTPIAQDSSVAKVAASETSSEITPRITFAQNPVLVLDTTYASDTTPVQDPAAARAAQQRNNETIALALDVLDSMAKARDSIVADTARRSLALYVDSLASQSHKNARPIQRAVAAIGSQPYPRALPVLDSLFRKQRSVIARQYLNDSSAGNRVTADALSEEMNKASVQAYTASLAPDSADGRRQLLLALRGLTNQPKTIVDDLKKRVRADSNAARNCDRNGDGNCDEKDEALLYIANNPADEYGYRDLVEHYAETKSYLAADTVLDRLRQQYPDEVWPLKILSENRHENLVLKSPEYFRKSYEDMRQLRTLKAYDALRDSARSEYDRIESDYIEVALSARRYGETDSLAQRILHAPARSARGAADVNLTTRRLNAALFAYMAYVMKGDRTMAEERLNQLGSIVRTLPSDFANNWSYPGTEVFIRRQNLPAALEQSLLKLCKSGPWYSQDEAAELIAENRQALNLLSQP